MKDVKLAVLVIASGVLALAPTAGCNVNAAGAAMISPPVAVRSQISGGFSAPVPVSAGTNVIQNGAAELDASNAADGYLMARYLTKTGKAVRVVVTTPDGTQYIYRLRTDSEYEVLPFSAGSGHYHVAVYENAFDNKYYAVLQAAVSVRLTDAFAPFLRPNQYVNYSADSQTAQTAAELTKHASGTVEKITAIYRYVVQNISYDYQLSESIQAGYVPDVDKVLRSGKGICFDYAAVTAAMLRSQGIPAKLVVGYRGADYHAWIRVYSNESGRMNEAVSFDGKAWQLLDPTIDSYANQNGGAWQAIGQGEEYRASYFY